MLCNPAHGRLEAATVRSSLSLVLRMCQEVHSNATLNTQRCSLANPHLSITVLQPIITFSETFFGIGAVMWCYPVIAIAPALVYFPPPHCYFSSLYFWACIVWAAFSPRRVFQWKEQNKKQKQRKARSLSNHVSPLPTVSAFILWHHMHFLQIFSCKTPCKHSSCSHIHNGTVFSCSHYRNNELVDACTQPRVSFG